MKRRKFLKFFGIGAITAPIIVKTVGEREQIKLIPPNKYNSSPVIVSGNEKWQYEVGMMLAPRYKEEYYLIIEKSHDVPCYTLKGTESGQIWRVTELTLLHNFVIVGQREEIWTD